MAFALDDFPEDCLPATDGLEDFKPQARLSPDDLVAFFRQNPKAADRLFQQSYDKRSTPSTFIEQTDSGYQVGWYDRERKHLRRFAEFPQAAADYLLFSFGAGRLRHQTI